MTLGTWYLATCSVCEPVLPQPFRGKTARNRWAEEHRAATGHVVVLTTEERK